MADKQGIRNELTSIEDELRQMRNNAFREDCKAQLPEMLALLVRLTKIVREGIVQ